jgi:hypothetical protein
MELTHSLASVDLTGPREALAKGGVNSERRWTTMQEALKVMERFLTKQQTKQAPEMR